VEARRNIRPRRTFYHICNTRAGVGGSPRPSRRASKLVNSPPASTRTRHPSRARCSTGGWWPPMRRTRTSSPVSWTPCLVR